MNSQTEPVVSAIVPARNEELNIARSIRSIAAQPEIFEIIAVDDQSGDRTGAILEGLKEQYPTLRVIRLSDLPERWAGKPHALAEGSRLASGEWLLFTDADTVHRPGSLGDLLDYARERSADLLSISPGQKLAAWWAKSILPLLFTQLAVLYPFKEVSDPHSPVAAANGQYILIRRAIYESVGGHAAAPSAILEDLELARRVKTAGGRLVFLPGAGWAETRMYRTFREMWAGWTKNLFLLYGSDPKAIRAEALSLLGRWLLRLVLIFSAMLLLGFGIFLRRRWQRPVILALGLVSLVAVLAEGTYRRRLHRAGFSPGLAKYFLLGAPFVSFLLLSSLRAYRAGFVQWKGRTYSVGQPQ